LLLGPPRLVAASGRPSIGSFLAMVVAAKRIINTFHHIGLVTEQLPPRTAKPLQSAVTAQGSYF
jgi:hypothetical protein